MRLAARFAYIAAVLFALRLAAYFVPALRDATLANAPALAIVVAVLPLAQYAATMPVAAALPAPGWARMSAYIWLIGATISDLMRLSGFSLASAITLGLLVNLLAAAWLLGASWRAPLAMRIVGIFVACDLAAYSLTAPFDASGILLALPSLVLLPLWLALAGRRLAHAEAERSPA